MSCLFRSLASYHKYIDQNDMRQIVCDHLDTNPIFNGKSAADIVKWESNTQLVDYIHNMRKVSTWGGAIEIKSYADLFQTSVAVHMPRGGGIVHFLPTTTPLKYIQIYWNGSHYEPTNNHFQTLYTKKKLDLFHIIIIITFIFSIAIITKTSTS